MGGKELKGAYKGLPYTHIRAEVSNFKKKRKNVQANIERSNTTLNVLHLCLNPTSNVLHRSFESNFKCSPLIVRIQLRTFGHI